MSIFSSTSYSYSGRKRRALPRVKKLNVAFKPLEREAVYRRETQEYKSAEMSSAVAARTEPPKYTGSLVKGIGTMHKSNAIPIINEEQMRDIARMRR